jgi:hypothetical protein
MVGEADVSALSDLLAHARPAPTPRRKARYIRAAARILSLSLILMMAAPLTARAASAFRPGSITMVSETGDFIGGGTNRLFDAPESVSLKGERGHVEVRVEQNDESFSFDFAAPSGKQLEVGEYVRAERYPFEGKGSPGLAVSGDGRGCNQDFGRFIIKSIHFNLSGAVDRFWALYEQHCESTEAPALFGEVRIGVRSAERLERVEPMAIDWPQTAVGASGVQVPVTFIAGESLAQIATVGIGGKDAADFSISSDGCTGTTVAPHARCELAAAVKPTAAGLRIAKLVITDTSGTKTTVALAVNTEPPPEPLMTSDSATYVSEPGDFIGGGQDRLFDAPGSVSISGGTSHVEVKAEEHAENLSFDFAPPSGKQLEVREYAHAERYPFEAKSLAGLSVTGNGRGCNQDFGRFIVKDIHSDASGNVDRFWALYEQHCESKEAPALFGEVRVGEPPTTAPETVAPTAIDWPHTAVGASGVHVPITVGAGESEAHVASIALEGEDAADFGIVSDSCGGAALAPRARCEIAVAVKPSAIGLRTAQLLITDKSGAKTTVPLAVRG